MPLAGQRARDSRVRAAAARRRSFELDSGLLMVADKLTRLTVTRAQEWLADHVAAMVWILLALWTPPIAFTVLVDLELMAGAGSGYLSLRDPGLLLSIMQIV